MLPSVVRFDGSGRPVELGYEARQNALSHPLSTVSSVKRLMGRALRDAAADVPYLSYRVVEGPQNTARLAIPLDDGSEKVVSPQEVSAIILRALREQAEKSLGVPVSKAVVTVPAYFDDAQRQATRDAGRLAGLEVVRIINEPTAAALAYGLGLRHAAGAARDAEVVVVYDLGGGTFDVSVLRITPSQQRTLSVSPAPADSGVTGAARPVAHAPASFDTDIFQVLSTAGDTHLGGDDFDNALVDLFTREINQRLGSGPGAATFAFPPETMQALRQFAESAKIRLSTVDHVAINIDLGAGRVYERTITRSEFEGLVQPLVDRTIAACRRALKDAKRRMEGETLAAVILVGGATRTPLVRRLVEEFFGLKPYTALNPDEVVALGAAVQGSVLASVIGGAAGGGGRSLLLDVVPLSLGIETVGGAMAKLIVRNSTVPAQASEMFSTGVDNQTGIKVHVLQGEREMAADCRSLARLELAGIPPMPAGIPKLRVDFLVDASGILTVQAAELRSGKRLEAQVVPNHGLTQVEVERLERESFAHAREDMTRHRIVDLIANAKLDVNWIDKQIERHGAKLAAAEAESLRSQVAALKKLIADAERDWASVDADAFHAAKEALDRASVRLHEVSIAESLREG